MKEDCIDCKGEGYWYDVCPYCGETAVTESHDITICTACQLILEGISKNEYPKCETCEGAGFIDPIEIKHNRIYNKADNQIKKAKEDLI